MKVAKTARGATRLGFDIVEGVTNIVEGMYRNIASLSPPLGPAPEGPAPGIAGVVHASVRQVTGAVRYSVDAALGLVSEYLEKEAPDSMASVALISALNGVVGDHLETTDNPLAIQMELVADRSQAGADILLVIHGLAMHHSFFTWKEHNHFTLIAEEHGYTPVWAHYNSGRHISTNGRELTQQIENLVNDWPVPVATIRIVGYSMGGLLARSALAAAAKQGHRWPKLTKQAVYLASPHHGSAVERGGNWFNAIFKVSPYSAPLAALGMVRSAGITDLRHGNVVDEDWQDDDRFAHHDDRRHMTPLAEGIQHYAIAGSLAQHPDDLLRRPLGDGLVAPRSALGDHKIPDKSLGITKDNRLIVSGTGHLDLLCHPEVYARLNLWLGKGE